MLSQLGKPLHRREVFRNYKSESNRSKSLSRNLEVLYNKAFISD